MLKVTDCHRGLPSIAKCLSSKAVEANIVKVMGQIRVLCVNGADRNAPR